MYYDPSQPLGDRAVKWTWSQYRDYLQSVQWTTLRLAALRMHGRACQVCGSEAKQLHHLIYREFPEWSRSEDLMPVCRECHKKIHKVFKVPMEREAVIKYFKSGMKPLITVDKAWLKEQKKKKPKWVPTRKQERAMIRAAKKAAKAGFADKWAWLIRRHPAVFGVRK